MLHVSPNLSCDELNLLHLTGSAEVKEIPIESQEPREVNVDEVIVPKKWAPVFDPHRGLQNLVAVWYFLYPEIELHPWQRDELMRISGYATGSRKTSERVHYFADNPFQACYVCCNGSGKDKVLIQTVAIGSILLYRNVYVVITSSSHEQLKNQTDTHIREGISRCNANSGEVVFESVEFHHKSQTRAGQIKLFVTDEPGRAEGWHPLTPDGLLIIIINETKSVKADILEAFDRCHGWSHWLEVSSPGPRNGMLFDNYMQAVKHPALPMPHHYYARRVDHTECPHIPISTFEKAVKKRGLSSYLVQTSFLANFYEKITDVFIPEEIVAACYDVVEPEFEEAFYGVGVDCAAGNDETVIYIRRRNKIIKFLAFVEADTIIAARRCIELMQFLLDHNHVYTLLVDDGGLGRTFVDQFTLAGFDVTRVLNQSAAFNKTKYLNLGAEIYGNVHDLYDRHQIPAPEDALTRRQLTTRRKRYEGNQGKIVLESKKSLKAKNLPSPDRGDAFALCYFSYKPGPPSFEEDKPQESNTFTPEQLTQKLLQDPLYFQRLLTQNTSPTSTGRPTILDQSYE